MNNFIVNSLVEKTWLNESEVKIILSVLTESLKTKHPDLGFNFDQIVNVEKDMGQSFPLSGRNHLIV